MLVTPAPGANRTNVLDALRNVGMNAGNLQGVQHSSAYARLLGYLEWANASLRILRNQVSTSDIDHLVLTPQYAALLAGASGGLAGTSQQRLVNSLVDLEVTERIRVLGEAVGALEQHLTRWPDDDSTAYLLPDTSFYIQHTHRLEKTDFTALLELRPDRRVHLLFPMVVVDELDALKESKGRARWRAGYTLAVLDRVLADTGRGSLREPSGFGEGEDVRCGITIEVLFDQPGHIRLPLPDDEIVDRCLGAHALAGAQGITLLTYDTGQSTRARFQKLQVRKFWDGAGTGEEPDWAAEEAKQGTGVRAKRRQRQQEQQQQLETRQRDDDA